VIDFCNLTIGSVIDPPEGADLPGGGGGIGGWIFEPIITPASSAFIHPYDGRVIANDIGALTIEWATNNGGAQSRCLTGWERGAASACSGPMTILLSEAGRSWTSRRW